MEGLRALPPLTDLGVKPEPLEVGPWCLADPIWGNPVMAGPRSRGGVGAWGSLPLGTWLPTPDAARPAGAAIMG